VLQPQMPEGPGFRGPPGPMGGPPQMGANPYGMPKSVLVLHLVFSLFVLCTNLRLAHDKEVCTPFIGARGCQMLTPLWQSIHK